MADLYLRENILNSIVARLPIKPLFRFKCVSKHWNRVIPSPDFMKLRSLPMILLSLGSLHAIDTMDCSIVDLYSSFGDLTGEAKIVGSFNRLVLLVIKSPDQRGHMILYNPFSKVSQAIPPSPWGFDTIHGFGYGKTCDDLKIVRIRNLDAQPGRCVIYSYKNRSWSLLIQTMHSYSFYDDVGTFVDVFLYWRASYVNKSLIVAFDVTKKLFSELRLPRKFLSRSCTLGSLNKRLALVRSTGNTCELWVMNEHAIGGSWSKNYSAKLVDLRGNYLNDFNPICILNEGRIAVLSKGDRLIICDTVKGSFREVNSSIKLNNILSTQVTGYDFGLTV